MTHAELIEVGSKWLKQFGCSLILCECVSLADETPDILAYKSGSSILVEAKASRSDFLADFKKWHRQHPERGMGNYRFYICPDGMIKKEELPQGWGLVYAVDSRPVVIVGPKDNTLSWCVMEGHIDVFGVNYQAENTILLAAMRKMAKKESKNCNYKIFLNAELKECEEESE